MTASSPKAWILDVGHGSATVIEDADRIAIIDGGRGETLLRFLLQKQITRIDSVIVSHADADHLGGISLLLSEGKIEVGQVYVNPDQRSTALWRDFVSVMIESKERGTQFNLEATNVNPGQLALGNTTLEVVSPSQELASRTSEGHTPGGAKLTPNSMSIVVRVWANESPRLLLAGDLDRVGLDSITTNDVALRAGVLVYPHHGGRPGTADPSSFAEEIAQAVRPSLVVFSIGRGKHATPRPEVVAAVMRSSEGVHIACTQLSEHCAAELPQGNPANLSIISEGLARNACCAGTLEISLEEGEVYEPSRDNHLAFIQQFAPTALCLRKVDSITRI